MAQDESSGGPAGVAHRKVAQCAMALVVLVSLLTASAYRIVKNHQTPGPFNPQKQGYCDFHNGVYFPALAFRERVSPYGQQYVRSYPVERSIPLYSPAVLWLHQPFTWMPLWLSELTQFGLSVGFIVLLAWISVRWACPLQNAETRWDLVLLIASAVVASRGGQQTLFTGYFTFELILGVLVAVHYGYSRPTLSGLGLALISVKPNIVLPIAGLMLARRQFKAVLIGTLVAIVGALLGLAWLLQSQSLSEIRDDIRLSQEIHQTDSYELPANTWTRIDLLAVYAKWTSAVPNGTTHLATMIVLLLPAAIVFMRRPAQEDAGAASPQGALLLVAATVAVYHQVYDALVLAPAIVALVIGRESYWRTVGAAKGTCLLFLMLLPNINYLSSLMFIERLGFSGITKDIVTSVNAVGLSLAMIILLRLVWTSPQGDQSDRT